MKMRVPMLLMMAASVALTAWYVDQLRLSLETNAGRTVWIPPCLRVVSMLLCVLAARHKYGTHIADDFDSAARQVGYKRAALSRQRFAGNLSFFSKAGRNGERVIKGREVRRYPPRPTGANVRTLPELTLRFTKLTSSFALSASGTRSRHITTNKSGTRMFGRGTWAVFGLAKESLEAFRTNLEDRAIMAAAVANGGIRHHPAIQLPIRSESIRSALPVSTKSIRSRAEHQEELAGYAITEHEDGSDHNLPAEILDCEGYGFTEAQFQLHATMPWYGLWAVSNEWKDVSDLASIKEQRSYKLLERPYRFLQAIDKKSVDQETLGVTAAVRKQVPVLLDFNEGRVYIENSNKKLIYTIMVRLQQLGAEIIPVAWTYTHAELDRGNSQSACTRARSIRAISSERADEATRFKAKRDRKARRPGTGSPSSRTIFR